VQLKGNAILDARGERPLDGNAFGRVAKVGYDVFTDLTLPSGDTIRGGDFESWCFLVPPTVPVTVMNIYPPRDSVFPADAPPDFVHVTFTKQVQVATLTTKDNFQLLDPSGQQVVGRIDPYPYSTTARTVDAVTFSPRAPLQAQERLNEFTVVLRGTGPTPILDVDGQPLGGGAPDFKSRFYLTPHLKGPVDTPGPIFQPPGPIFRPPGPIFEPPGPIVEPPGPILQPPGPILQPPGPILRGPGPILRGLGPIAQPPGPILREPDPMMPEAGPGSLGGRALPGPQVAPSPEEAG
jgi:hypothetical protein